MPSQNDFVSPQGFSKFNITSINQGCINEAVQNIDLFSSDWGIFFAKQDGSGKWQASHRCRNTTVLVQRRPVNFLNNCFRLIN